MLLGFLIRERPATERPYRPRAVVRLEVGDGLNNPVHRRVATCGAQPSVRRPDQRVTQTLGVVQCLGGGPAFDAKGAFLRFSPSP